MSLSAVGLKTHIWNNNLRSIALLAFYPFLLLGLVWVLGYAFAAMVQSGGYGYGAAPDRSIAFANRVLYEYWPAVAAVVAVWFTISWFFNAALVRQAAHARPVTRAEEPALYNLIENLCISRGIAVPRLEIIETPARNAFASGMTCKTYGITVTRGLMEALRPDELEGVLAHELTHILNRDVRLLMVCVVFTGLIGFVAQMAWSSVRYSMLVPRSGSRRNGGGVVVFMLLAGVVLWLGYLASLLARFALSRRREYMADAGAVELTRNPDAMMRALLRISGQDRIPGVPEDIALMCTANSHAFLGLIATHPPIEARVRAISEMTGTPVPGSGLAEEAKNPWI